MTQQSRPFQISKDDLVSGFLLEKTAKLMKLHFSRMLLLHPEIDITVDQWIILDLLHSGEKINQQKLAELAFKDAPTVTRILDILEQKKYIARKTDKGDRRKFDISLLAISNAPSSSISTCRISQLLFRILISVGTCLLYTSRCV